VNHRFKVLNRVGVLAVIWLLYVEMINCLTIKILLLCRLSTGAVLCSVHGRVFNIWRTAIYLWREFTRLKDTLREFITQHGWQHNLRIGPSPP
jgi:hypothetical protein